MKVISKEYLGSRPRFNAALQITTCGKLYRSEDHDANVYDEPIMPVAHFAGRNFANYVSCAQPSFERSVACSFDLLRLEWLLLQFYYGTFAGEATAIPPKTQLNGFLSNSPHSPPQDERVGDTQ